eukprot:GHVT01049806.1.p1 GENE.GHVT01049806.1~~GHVT01049806.1.p1  ORF type:complete len:116 (+),score=4.72 GHVT01049806.1:95-442(+)
MRNVPILTKFAPDRIGAKSESLPAPPLTPIALKAFLHSVELLWRFCLLSKRGAWSKNEMRMLQRALNLTRSGNAKEVKVTNLLCRSVALIQAKIEQLHDKGLIVENFDGYRIVEP